jgi:hypothetical protein
MSQSSAFRSDPEALAAAMSRHPAAGVRATVTPLFGAAPGGGPAPSSAPAGAASFTTVAALLTGPWRVNDPVGFAAAMRAAPLVAGHPVIDLAACARQPTAGFDPLSAAVAGHLEAAAGAAAFRAGLAVRWVAAPVGPDLYVEAAALAPADDEGPEVLVLAHLVEPAGPAAPALAGRSPADDSWVVVVVGDGQGGVSGIGRASLSRHPAPGPARPAVRLGLGPLRARLAGPARAAEGLASSDCSEPADAIILPFRR